MIAIPPEIRVITDGDRTRLIFPNRPQSGQRWMGCMPIGFGLIFSGFAVFWILGASGMLDGQGNMPAPPLPMGPEEPVFPPPAAPARGFDWAGLLMAAFGLPFVFAGLVPIWYGILAFMDSHAEIEIDHETLTAIRVAGPFRIRRQRKLSQISKFRIASYSGGSQVQAWHKHTIIAECVDVPVLHVVNRYARDWLTPVAHYLANEMRRRDFSSILRPNAEEEKVTSPDIAVTVEADPEAAELSLASEDSPDAVTSIPTPEIAEETIPDQPADSKIVFVGSPESLTFAVPRTGFRGTAAFFLMFSVIWNGITFFISAFFAWDFFRHPSWESLLPLAFLSLFMAIGVVMGLAAIQLAFRRAVLLATRDSLVFTQNGPIRNAEYHWAPTDLAAIRSDHSGTTINDRRLRELQIHDKHGSKRGMFDGRDDAEIEWMAVLLRRFYAVKAS